MASKRVDLISNVRHRGEDYQAGASIELVDIEPDGPTAEEQAVDLIKRGKAKPAKLVRVFGHENEMPDKVRVRAFEELAAADAVAGPRNQEARAAALAAYRK